MHIKDLHITSDTVQLSGLESLKGKTVDVYIVEKKPDEERKKGIEKFFELAETINLDYESIENLRKISMI